MKKLITIITLALCLPSFGAWIVGTNSDVLGYPYGTKVIFHPLTGPLAENNHIILDVQRTTALDTNGGFRCWLAGGYYNMDFGPLAAQIEIAVPANNTNTFTAIQCAQAVTNLFTFGMDPTAILQLVLSNVPPQNLLSTNAGALGEIFTWLTPTQGYWTLPGQATNVNLIAGANITLVTNAQSTWTISSTGSTGSGVTNNQQLPGINGSTNFQANLAGSSNLFVNPQTIYVRTNGNNSTATRGDPSLAWSTLSGALASAQYGDTIQTLGQLSAFGTYWITNLTLKGNGQVLTVSNTAGAQVALITTNSALQDLIITNGSQAVSAVIGTPSYTTSVTNGDFYGRNLRVYGNYQAALFKHSYFYTGPQPVVDIRDSIFSSHVIAMETWGGLDYFNNCHFICENELAGDGISTVVCNDHSTNFFNACTITADGPANVGNGQLENIGIIAFQNAYSTFNGCDIRVSAGVHPTNDCAVWISEDVTYTAFNHCYFNLAYNQQGMVALCRTDTNTPVSGTVVFNNCYYWPETNGVIVVNGLTNVVVRVSGGNLKRSNFLHPEWVWWADTLEATNADIAYVINTNGAVIMDTRNYILNDEAGMNSVIFGGGVKVLGNAGQIAVDWANRELDDTSSNPVMDWGTPAGPRLAGNWTVLGRITNSALTQKTVVVADGNKALSSIPNAIGFLNNDGSGNFSYLSPGVGGSATNAIVTVGSNDTVIVSPSTNLVFWQMANVNLGVTNRNSGTADVSYTLNPSLTNISSITFSNSAKITSATGGNSNAVEIVNKVGQPVAKFGTNGATVFGTNNQFVLDTSGNETISGQFNGSLAGATAGSLPISAIATVGAWSVIGNANFGAAAPASTFIWAILDGIGTMQGGIPIRTAGAWTNSALTSQAAQLASANVTNNLNALNFTATNIATFQSGAQFFGAGPAISWSNNLGANANFGYITTNGAYFFTNADTGVWTIITNGSYISSNAVNASWVHVGPQRIISSNGISGYQFTLTNGWGGWSQGLTVTNGLTNTAWTANTVLVVGGQKQANSLASASDGWMLSQTSSAPVYTINGGALTNISNAIATNLAGGSTIGANVNGANLTNTPPTGVIGSNTFPVTASFGNLATAGGILWNSNGYALYYVETNGIAGNASTNQLWPITGGGGGGTGIATNGGTGINNLLTNLGMYGNTVLSNGNLTISNPAPSAVASLVVTNLSLLSAEFDGNTNKYFQTIVKNWNASEKASSDAGVVANNGDGGSHYLVLKQTSGGYSNILNPWQTNDALLLHEGGTNSPNLFIVNEFTNQNANSATGHIYTVVGRSTNIVTDVSSNQFSVRGVGGSVFYGDNNDTNYLSVTTTSALESNAVGRVELRSDAILSSNRLTGSFTSITNGIITNTGVAQIGGRITSTNGVAFPTNCPALGNATIVIDANMPRIFIKTNAAFAIAGIANLDGAGIVNEGVIIWTNSNNALLSSTFGGGWRVNKQAGANTVSTWSVTNGTGIAEWKAMSGYFSNVTLWSSQ